MSDPPEARPRRRVFFVVNPEEVGARWERSDQGALLVLDAWLGDDLLSAHPTFLSTEPLVEAFRALPGLTGVQPRLASVARSPFLAQTRPNLELPPLWALEIDGRPGADDAGLTRDGSLVVSQRVMDVVVQHRVGRAVFSVYPGAGLTSYRDRGSPLASLRRRPSSSVAG